MSTPEAEYERVLKKFAALRWTEACFYGLVIAGLMIVSRFHQVDWFILAAVTSGVIFWEITKYRLRRNARDFARASR